MNDAIQPIGTIHISPCSVDARRRQAQPSLVQARHVALIPIPRDLQLAPASHPNTSMTNLPPDFVPVDFEFEFLRRDRDGNPYIMVNPVNDLSDPSMVSVRIPINNPPSQLLPMQLAKSE